MTCDIRHILYSKIGSYTQENLHIHFLLSFRPLACFFSFFLFNKSDLAYTVLCFSRLYVLYIILYELFVSVLLNNVYSKYKKKLNRCHFVISMHEVQL